ncbi:MAG TPA: zeta toxin family protein [Planctomycetota bacterium]|nr:zeta toxin family protein [Planctomycetota bacterium]
MEKDILLEYASIGHLTIGMEKTKEIDEDLSKLGMLRENILISDPKDINYEQSIEEINKVRKKYEKKNEQISLIEDNKLQEIWGKEIIKLNPFATPNQKNPQGFVLGGQPGSGKSNLLLEAKKKLSRNFRN